MTFINLIDQHLVNDRLQVINHFLFKVYWYDIYPRFQHFKHVSSMRESRHICLHRPKCLCKIAQDWLSVTHVLTGFSVGSNIYWRPPCWNEQGSKVQREDTRRLASLQYTQGRLPVQHKPKHINTIQPGYISLRGWH